MTICENKAFLSRGFGKFLYMLKKHKRKLKLCGLGPFVVSDLNTNGAEQLEKLDGESMGNYINGSHLKQYEEPMTEDMLVCLHAAQIRNPWYKNKPRKRLKHE